MSPSKGESATGCQQVMERETLRKKCNGFHNSVVGPLVITLPECEGLQVPFSWPPQPLLRVFTSINSLFFPFLFHKVVPSPVSSLALRI